MRITQRLQIALGLSLLYCNYSPHLNPHSAMALGVHSMFNIPGLWENIVFAHSAPITTTEPIEPSLNPEPIDCPYHEV